VNGFLLVRTGSGQQFGTSPAKLPVRSRSRCHAASSFHDRVFDESRMIRIMIAKLPVWRCATCRRRSSACLFCTEALQGFESLARSGWRPCSMARTTRTAISFSRHGDRVLLCSRDIAAMDFAWPMIGADPSPVLRVCSAFRRRLEDEAYTQPRTIPGQCLYRGFKIHASHSTGIR